MISLSFIEIHYLRQISLIKFTCTYEDIGINKSILPQQESHNHAYLPCGKYSQC